MVETEMSTLARRFFFLLGAWLRLQGRLLRGQAKLVRGRLVRPPSNDMVQKER
jgi:hypothetical protein